MMDVSCLVLMRERESNNRWMRNKLFYQSFDHGKFSSTKWSKSYLSLKYQTDQM